MVTSMESFVAVSDTELGVDLFRLWRSGKVLLPRIATVYEQDNQDLHNTGFQDSEAFNRFGVPSPVAAPWQALRDSLVTLFADMATTIDLAGDALCTIATAYAEVDQEASTLMQEQITNYQADPELPQDPGPIEVEQPSDPIVTQVGADGIEVPVR
jgi:hypothetical protein